MSKICGIYVLRFKGTDKVYIGQSGDINRRFSTHLNELKKGKSARKLQRAFELFGEPLLEILLECSKDELNTNEISAIEVFDSLANGFNGAEGGGSFPITEGQDNAVSKYSNNEVETAFLFLVNNPDINLYQASSIVGVHRSTLKNINNGYSHKWLEKIYPIEYNILMSRKGSRPVNSLEYSGKPIPIAISPEGEEFEVYHITNFAKEHGLNRGAFGNMLRGNAVHHKGWYSGGFV